ncbi:hypothetical protein FDUTEX481_00114 [Tolypothrix sp. PCC 7601]|nr:hypothetical protein FDUTEX481_00114 [Tolypothrix sp. PCC 7601]
MGFVIRHLSFAVCYSPIPITPYPQRGPRVPQSPIPNPQSPLPLIPRGGPEFPIPKNICHLQTFCY